MLPVIPFWNLDHFLGVVSLVFFNFGMVQETHIKLCVTEQDFLEKVFFPKKIGKMGQKLAKNRFFEFIGKFGH